MTKIYVLDSNVLLTDPTAIYAFPGATVVIPGVVIEEIDAKKYGYDGTSFNAREVARQLDSLRREAKLDSPVPLGNGSTLQIELNHRSLAVLKSYFTETTNDNRLLAIALNIQAEEAGKENPARVILVSQDTLIRIKSDALGLEAEEYHPSSQPSEAPYTGYREVTIEQTLLDRFYLENGLAAAEVAGDLQPNEYLVMKSHASQSGLGRYCQASGAILPLRYPDQTVWGINPRNVQQKIAFDLLLDPEVQLVTITGRAGTGKTLLALAAGLYLTQDNLAYQKLLMARPIIPMGRDIGYLPGNKNEKLRPWLQPLYDNLELLFSHRKGTLEETMSGMKNIEIEALTYIRGRTLPDQYIIIDEAQNLTGHEVKTIITRVGEGSKLVLLGDTDQIDHPYLNRSNNGLSVVVEKMAAQPIAGHIKLNKGERSPLARLGADLL